jgi:hypothetical protein
MFTGLFEGATSSQVALCYNNLQARVFIPSTLIYTKYVLNKVEFHTNNSRVDNMEASKGKVVAPYSNTWNY